MSTGAQLLDTTASPGDITRRELYFFNLYRCLEAIIYTGLVFSPVIKLDFVRLTHAELGQIAALAYLATQTTSLANYRQGASYDIVARFTNIGQLKLRSPLKVAGVRVGRLPRRPTRA